MFKAFVFGAALALAPLGAVAATLGLTTGDPFLTGGSYFERSDGAYAQGMPDGDIWFGDLGWTGLSTPGGVDEYGLGFAFLVHPDDTVSWFQLFVDDHIFGGPLLQSYTLGGFGFTADAMEFLLEGVVSDEPWIGDRVLLTIGLGRSFENGVYAALLSDLGKDDFLGPNTAGYDTDVAFANVLAAPVPASLPLLLSAVALLWIRRRSTPG